MNITKAPKPSGFVSLLNIENLRDQFRLGQNNAPNEPRKDQKHNNFGNTLDQNVVQSTIDPKDVELFFENPFTHNMRDCPQSTLHTKHIDQQGALGKFDKFINYPLATSQGFKDVLPKRVSFNDIPDVIATQEVGNENIMASQEGWKSDYSNDEENGSIEGHPFKKQCKLFSSTTFSFFLQ